MKFKKNDTIDLDLGSNKATVIEEIGRGGQGVVYRVSLNGKEYALKWYLKAPKKSFYENLKQNIAKGAPDKTFLWPLFLTNKDSSGSFGYIMELRPPEYVEFSQFLLAKTRFSDVEAMIMAATNICNGFRALHNKGYSYQDVNDGNFFINPKNGDVLICDNDNVAPFGENSGIVGKCRYMAPEVVSGKSKPNSQSDRFSLSVILFLLFFGNHPLEGKNITSCPCLTEKHEKALYGNSAIFIYDPNDDSNRPVPGIHVNVLKRWHMYPQYLQDMFVKAFSKESLLNPNVRVMEKELVEKVFQPLYRELIKCHCGASQFIEPQNTEYRCISCKNEYNRPPVLKVDNKLSVLGKDKIAYRSMIDGVSSTNGLDNIIGEVIESRKHPGIFGMKNLTEDTWILTMKDGTQRTVEPGKPVPLLLGNQINFGKGISGEVI